MSAELVKARCITVAESVKGHHVAAELAGVVPSTWSDYCNLNKPDITIPLHRALRLVEATKVDRFSDLFDGLGDRETSGDPRLLGAGALEAIASAEVAMARAYADGTITEAEKRELLAIAQRLVERSQEFAACIAGIHTGSVPPRATPRG